jgi:ABC-type uncharacterized transport system auxiliary subunit
MRRAFALTALLATLAGCASAPQSATPLAVHDETLEPQASVEVCYQLIFCPLVSSVELAR